MHLAFPAVLSALLFSVGVYGVLARRNAILVLMAVELMLNAVNLNLVAFDIWLRDRLHSGQALALFTVAIAAAEIGIGLAIVLLVYRGHGTPDVDRFRDTAEVGPGGPRDLRDTGGPGASAGVLADASGGPGGWDAPGAGAEGAATSAGADLLSGARGAARTAAPRPSARTSSPEPSPPTRGTGATA